MASEKSGATGPEHNDSPEATDKEVEAIPVETLKSLAELIARYPDQMLRVIRRYMDDEETD